MHSIEITLYYLNVTQSGISTDVNETKWQELINVIKCFSYRQKGLYLTKRIEQDVVSKFSPKANWGLKHTSLRRPIPLSED